MLALISWVCFCVFHNRRFGVNYSTFLCKKQTSALHIATPEFQPLAKPTTNKRMLCYQQTMCICSQLQWNAIVWASHGTGYPKTVHRWWSASWQERKSEVLRNIQANKSWRELPHHRDIRHRTKDHLQETLNTHFWKLKMWEETKSYKCVKLHH